MPIDETKDRKGGSPVFSYILWELGSYFFNFLVLFF